ncbi:MAG TPA: Uma2 family endonuclease, partial [Gemmataceae bacterium]|nr:Uma2 family endonuclease [Gemmataceae bacterium]
AIMTAVIFQDPDIRVPGWVVDFDSFHRWVDSDQAPEHARIDFLQDEVWIDAAMSEEQVFTHVRIKTELNRALANLDKAERKGMYLADGLRLIHRGAALSAVPDGTFILRESLRADRIRLIRGARRGFVRAEGSPDLVVEVVSDASVQKDTVRLRDLYWQAGVREYWLVDARGDQPTLNILRHTAKGYVGARKQAAWIRSGVLDKSFQLAQEIDADGYPEYTLLVR